MTIAEISGKAKLVLTAKEADEIRELLETLEAMGGVYDESFTKDCNRAGIISKRLKKSIDKIKYNKSKEE